MSTGKRKVLTGRVVSSRMDKTAVVAVEWRQAHPVYRKAVRKRTKAYAHDERNECSEGDVVRIEETRPLSRLKRWRLVEIVERREVPEVKPTSLDPGLMEESGARPQSQADHPLDSQASEEAPS